MKRCRICDYPIEERFIVCWKCYNEGKLAEVIIDDVFDKNKQRPKKDLSSEGRGFPEPIRAGSFMKENGIDSWEC